MNNGLVVCPKCGWNGSSKFNAHIKQLNRDNPFVCICGKCSEAFQRKTLHSGCSGEKNES